MSPAQVQEETLLALEPYISMGVIPRVTYSHVSAEPAGALMLETLGKKPLITAEMRLGEGTGAVAAMTLLDMALAVYSEAYTFDDCGVEAYQPQGSGV